MGDPSRGVQKIATNVSLSRGINSDDEITNSRGTKMANKLCLVKRDQLRWWDSISRGTEVRNNLCLVNKEFL